MNRPKEKKEILRKLRIIAKHLKTFNIEACYSGKYHKYLSVHYTCDWIECADILVTKGELHHLGDDKYELVG